MKKRNTRIDWHAGFAGGLELCFIKNLDDITIEREYDITKESPRIDFLLIKKERDTVIDNDIGRAFKKHNIIEYKNPHDALTLDVIWKTIGYAGLYKGYGKKVNEILEDEMTITIVRSSYPRKVFSYCKEKGRIVKRISPGVYQVSGFSAIDLQVIVTRELEDESLLALKIMMADAREEDIRRFIEQTEDLDEPGLLEDARVVVKVSSSVNKRQFEELLKEKEAMTTIEKLEAAREKAIADSREEGKEEKEVENIRSLMKNLSLSAKDAMKALEIPASKQKKYVTML